MVVVLAWYPALSGPYHYDDFNTPLGDPASQSISAWFNAMPQTLRPLTKLTYALESSLGALDAPARRIFNTALFALCATFLASCLRAAGIRRDLATLTAVAWAVHPVHAETIVALAGRPVLLALCLTLASASRLLTQRYGLAVALAFLALLARESALPWLLVCTAWSASRMGWSRARVWGTAAALTFTGIVVIARVRSLRELVTSSLGAASAYNRLGLQWAALFRGTSLLFTDPWAFNVDMDFAPVGGARLGLILGTLTLYGVALYIGTRRHHALAVRILAWLWLCLVVPTHSVIPKVDVLTARPFSASSAPLFGMVVVGALALAARYARPHLWVALGLVASILALVPLTIRRASCYQDAVELWTDAAAQSTRTTRPLINLSTHLAQRGRLTEAESALRLAAQREPHSLEVRARLGAVHHHLQNVQRMERFGERQ